MQQAKVKPHRKLNLMMLRPQRRPNPQMQPDWLRLTRPTLAGYESAISMWDHGISIWFWVLVKVVCCAGEAGCVLGVHEGYRLSPVHLQYLSVLLSSSVLSGLKLLAQSLDRWPCYQQHTAQQRHAFIGVWSPRNHTRWFTRHSYCCLLLHIFPF